MSGYLENNEPLRQAVIEIKEETGLENDDVQMVRSGDALLAIDPETPNISYKIHPYLFQSKSKKIRLSREHDQYEWIAIGELWRYDTVPKLKEAYESVAGSLHDA